MKNFESQNINDFIFMFYFMSVFSSPIIMILLTGELIHFSTGMILGKFQSRVFAMAFVLIYLYSLFQLFYKIPHQNGGLSYVKEMIKRLFSSYFFYIFLLQIIYPFISSFYNLKYYWLVNLLLIILCLITQYIFLEDVRYLIYGEVKDSAKQ